jgi:hypothetical protein
MSKYYPLQEYLMKIPEEVFEIKLSLDFIQNNLQIKLPDSANKKKFWANDRTNSRMQAVAWLSAGWIVNKYSSENSIVFFQREIY